VGDGLKAESLILIKEKGNTDSHVTMTRLIGKEIQAPQQPLKNAAGGVTISYYLGLDFSKVTCISSPGPLSMATRYLEVHSDGCVFPLDGKFGGVRLNLFFNSEERKKKAKDSEYLRGVVQVRKSKRAVERKVERKRGATFERDYGDDCESAGEKGLWRLVLLSGENMRGL